MSPASAPKSPTWLASRSSSRAMARRAWAREGAAPTLVLWAITEDIRTLGKLLQATLAGGNQGNALRDLRVRKDRQEIVANAARRLKPQHIERALLQAARLDKLIKGLRQGDVWDELLQLGLRLAG